MLRLTRIRFLAAALVLIALATGTGAVLSQGSDQNDDHLPCANHPCEGYIYEVLYSTVDGNIKGAVARDGRSGGAPPPGSGIELQSGTAVIVLTDPAQIRVLADLMASPTGSQEYYVDLTTFALKKRGSLGSDSFPPTEPLLFFVAVATALVVLTPVVFIGWRRIRNRRAG